MADADNMQAMLEQQWNVIDSDSDGICDLCNIAVDAHPCGEHQAAAIAKQAQDVADEQGRIWGMPSRIEGGQF